MHPLVAHLTSSLYVIKDVDGVKVGLIGITIAGKTTNSSRPLDSTTFN
jgi:5'-nucleotidase/UDP-sugar diphosphatase